MKIDWAQLLKTPTWFILLIIGVICIILGASQKLVLSKIIIQLSYPYNLFVIIVGLLFLLLGRIGLIILHQMIKSIIDNLY